MKCLIALRYPMKKHQLDTVRKAVQILGKRHKYYVIHITHKDASSSRDLIRKEIGISPEVIARQGDMVIQLKKAVKETKADIVIVGSHKKNILDVMLSGIVETDPTVEFIKAMKVPILIVK